MTQPRERVRVVVLEYEEIARAVAGRIAEVIRERNAAGRPAVLGLATGSTPIGIYRELIRLHREEGLDFSSVVTFNLDEYFPMRRESIHSYHRFMWENLFAHVNVRRQHVHLPPSTCRAARWRRRAAPTRRRSGRWAGSTSRSWGSGRRVTSASTNPGPASRAARA